MKRTLKNRNFDIFSGHAFYMPGLGGMVVLLLLLLAGACLGSFVSAAVALLYGGHLPTECTQLISYPLMFVPALIYVGIKSHRDLCFEQGISLNSSHFGKAGAWGCAIMAAAATLAAAFMTDLVSSLLPPMPQWLKDTLESLTGGNIWLGLLSVSVMAPLFEEWLCRGMILRGLLNKKKSDGSRLMHPAGAIAISAAFFALIHFNPWQAVPAFILGCLFGYVYYKTGSLWMTMLMHCVNNTFSTICANIDALQDMEFFTDLLPAREYAVLFCACGLLLVLIFRSFARIELQSPAGNCDPVNL